MTTCFGRPPSAGACGWDRGPSGGLASQLSVGVAQRVVLDMFAEAGGVRVALGAAGQLAGIGFLFQWSGENGESDALVLTQLRWKPQRLSAAA